MNRPPVFLIVYMPYHNIDEKCTGLCEVSSERNLCTGAQLRPFAVSYGAVLDPIDSLEKMECELEVPVVASNPAMLWFMLSQLELSYPIPGYGKLLSSWPALAVEG